MICIVKSIALAFIRPGRTAFVTTSCPKKDILEISFARRQRCGGRGVAGRDILETVGGENAQQEAPARSPDNL